MQFEDIAKIVTFVMTILPIVEDFAGSITSWKRTGTHNATVGGVVHSDHLVGLAMDVVFDDPSKVREFCIQCQVVGLYTLIEENHVHVQASPLKVKQVF